MSWTTFINTHLGAIAAADFSPLKSSLEHDPRDAAGSAPRRDVTGGTGNLPKGAAPSRTSEALVAPHARSCARPGHTLVGYPATK